MDTDVETHEIIRIIIMLAHGLGLKVVAEGVETQVQADMLKDLDCELAQGYLYSRPVPSSTIDQLLSDRLVRELPGRLGRAAGSTSA